MHSVGTGLSSRFSSSLLHIGIPISFGMLGNMAVTSNDTCIIFSVQ